MVQLARVEKYELDGIYVSKRSFKKFNIEKRGVLESSRACIADTKCRRGDHVSKHAYALQVEGFRGGRGKCSRGYTAVTPTSGLSQAGLPSSSIENSVVLTGRAIARSRTVARKLDDLQNAGSRM
jgi:hypothetical protein